MVKRLGHEQDRVRQLYCLPQSRRARRARQWRDSGVGAFTIVGMRHMHVVGRLALMVVRMPRTIPCPWGEAHTDGPHRVAMLRGSLPLRLLIIFELHICVLLAVVFELYSTQEEGTTPEPGRAGKGKGEEEGEEVVVVASEPERGSGMLTCPEW